MAGNGLDKYLVKTYEGLEKILAQELESLGAQDIKIGRRSVEFSGTRRTMYRANLELRTAIRVLQPLQHFRIREAQDIYRQVKKYAWEKVFDLEQTFKITKLVHSDFFNNTNYAALICKDAIVDRFQEVHGSRPSVAKDNPDIVIDIHVIKDHVHINLDTSGETLHKRKYKRRQTHAPISEVLAAGMVQIAKAYKYDTFINPMCGSGTIAIEAYNYLHNVPSQISRRGFSFKNYPTFDEEQWNLVLKGARMRIDRNPQAKIQAYDIEYNAISATMANTKTAGCYKHMDISQSDFFAKEVPAGRGLVIMNPPYDQRLKLRDVQNFYRNIGSRLKAGYKMKDVWIIATKDPDLLRNMGLKPKKSITLYNGSLECRFNKYEM